MDIGVITCIFLILIFSVALTQTAFAETERLVIAARSYEQIAIYLNQGDELKFAMAVSGGSNDDISLTIFFPDGTDVSGGVYEEHSDSFVATSTGTYVFSFDNSFSLLSNKFVSFSYERIQNTFYISVDELPQWADYAKNVVFESIKAWMDANQQLNFYVASDTTPLDLRIKWVKDFGGEHVGYAYSDEFIEVGLGDSNCKGKWQPYSANHIEHIMKHEVGHILGLDHVDDPNSIMYAIALNREYGLVEEEYTIKEKHAQFIPLCTTKKTTAYSFSVKTDDPTYGFDVYFVPSSNSINRWFEGKPFQYYTGPSCFGEGFLSFPGRCEGVGQESGLLIIMNDKLTDNVNKITLESQEIPNTTGRTQPIDWKIHTYASAIIEEFLNKAQESAGSISTKQETRDQTQCGPGTVLKNGVCVVESTRSQGGGCLIATATYGSELAPQVQELREIRDNILLQTQSGSSFMETFNKFYYSFSPTIADWERESPLFKETVKLAITPLLTSLSIMQFVEEGSENQILGLGIGIIALNLGMYIVAPALTIITISRRIR